jgi:diguanylate cyclase (GGDEF)-like protein
MELNEPLTTAIVYVDPDTIDEELSDRMKATSSVRNVVVPLVVDNEVIAWIGCDVERGAERLRPSPELERRLQGLAALATIALDNMLLLERVHHHAHHDPLTGLANRKLLFDRLATAPRPIASVLLVDLDAFKAVNDGFGHEAGDLLLCQVADRLTSVIRDDDLVARLGGDEFAVVVFDPKAGSGDQVAARVAEVFDAPFELLGQRLTITASVGVAEGATNAADLLRHADASMYGAKAGRKGSLPRASHVAAGPHQATIDADVAAGDEAGRIRAEERSD